MNDRHESSESDECGSGASCGTVGSVGSLDFRISSVVGAGDPGKTAADTFLLFFGWGFKADLGNIVGGITGLGW